MRAWVPHSSWTLLQFCAPLHPLNAVAESRRADEGCAPRVPHRVTTNTKKAGFCSLLWGIGVVLQRWSQSQVLLPGYPRRSYTIRTVPDRWRYALRWLQLHVTLRNLILHLLCRLGSHTCCGHAGWQRMVLGPRPLHASLAVRWAGGDGMLLIGVAEAKGCTTRSILRLRGEKQESTRVF